MRALSPEKKEEHRQKIATTMRALIAAEPWRKDKMRETAARSLNVWAQSDEGRQKSSETAVVTSARPEIQAARAENLKNWRDENPEKFFEIVEKYANSFRSRPEEVLFDLLASRYDDVKRGQSFQNCCFTNKSRRRQVDIVVYSKRAVVEYDGPYHFGASLKKNAPPLEQVQKKDAEFNEVLSSDGWTVIRVGMSQYSQRRGGCFIDGCIERICDFIDAGVPGVYKIGEEYSV